VYGPGINPAGETPRESTDGAMPDAGVTVSQDALVVAAQASVPPPLLLIWMG